MTGYKIFFDSKRSTNEMSSLLNVCNGCSKSEEFSLNNIEVLVDNKEQNWFKRARVGKFLGLVHIQKLIARLAGKDHKSQPSSRLKGGSVADHDFVSDDRIQKSFFTKTK